MRALWLRRVGISLALALALGYLPYRVYRRSGLSRYVALRAELVELRRRNDKLRLEARRLRAELEALGGADALREGGLPLGVVERAARDELGLVRAGEVVYQVVAEGAR
jgi:cell division protein FtsB